MNKSQILNTIMGQHRVFYDTVRKAQLAPMAIIFTPEGSMTVILDQIDNQEALEDSLHRVIKAHGAFGMAIISESWVVLSRDIADMDIRPRDSDKRFEAVSTLVVDREGSIAGIQRIERDFSTGEVTHLTDIDETSGAIIGDRFAGLFD